MRTSCSASTTGASSSSAPQKPAPPGPRSRRTGKVSQRCWQTPRPRSYPAAPCSSSSTTAVISTPRSSIARAWACAEARQRVKSGIVSAELEFPRGRVTVNLAPAGLRKEGSGYDLPIALAILAASRQLPHEELDRHASVGELALDGRLRRVGGVLGVAEGARRMGLEHRLCPAESAAEAALAGIEPIPLRHLADAVAYLRGDLEPDPILPLRELELPPP